MFFESTDALVSRDDNNAPDVYEWDNGKVSLISDGRYYKGSYFVDSSRDGKDVFFATGASLVSQDIDNGDQDIYVARADGGFRAPDPAPECQADCRLGTTDVPPAPPTVATVPSLRPSSRGQAAQALRC